MAKKNSEFKKRVKKELEGREGRKNFRLAMDSIVKRRKEAFSDKEELEYLRNLGNYIKVKALSNLPDLLERLESNCQKNGIKVHWAQTSDSANNIILDIIRTHNANKLVKGKSMVSEEIHLNDFLEENGIECIETDLGEYIIQLAKEKPYHIIVPAIHKDKRQIAKLFEEKLGTKYTEEIKELTKIARAKLRKKFREAQIGLSGVNFAVADTGTLCLVENEGNGRMCTTVPPVHIAIMGIEKVVEKLEEVPPLLSLLTRSATGQKITTYFNMINSPRKENEKDGPDEVHLVILDNGRSKIYANKEVQEALLCIRCGACLNHCPIYLSIGGHGYGYVYPGPIGKILTTMMEGMKKAGELPTASSLCNACSEVCPVKIPLADIIIKLRNEAVEKPRGSNIANIASNERQKNLIEGIIWKLWRMLYSSPRIYRLLLSVGRPIMYKRRLNFGPLKEWNKFRVPPKLAKESLNKLLKQRGVDYE